MRSDDPDQSSEEEPTAVRETAHDFAMKQTALDLSAAQEDDPRLARLLKSSVGPGTPKLNELGQLLKELRDQRLDEAPARQLKTTLRSIDGEQAREAVAKETMPSQPAQLPEPRRPTTSGVSQIFRAQIFLGMILGGLLVAGGVVLEGMIAAPGGETALQLSVEPADARITVGDLTLPATGRVSLPCNGPITVTIAAPGFVSERHHLGCGTEAVIHSHLAPVSAR